MALARAIVSRPAAFLMDEPLSNLDAKFRAQTRLELVDLHSRLGTTFVYVTHDQVEAMTMATRIAIMTEGRLQQVGPPQAVYERPHNLFVARFIGSPPMNTIAGTFVVDDGRGLRRPGRGPVPAGRRRTRGRRRRDEGRRRCPSRALADRAGTDRGDHRRGRVARATRRHIVCDLAGEKVTIREPSSAEHRVEGTTVRLTAEPEQVHLFSPDTTERLN